MQLLEIEKELTSPNAAEAVARYDAQLLALEARLKEALRMGLSPEDYARCEPLGEVITIARKLIRLQAKGGKI